MKKMKFRDLSRFWKSWMIGLTLSAVLLLCGLAYYVYSTLGQLLAVML